MNNKSISNYVGLKFDHQNIAIHPYVHTYVRFGTDTVGSKTRCDKWRILARQGISPSVFYAMPEVQVPNDPSN